MKSISEKVRRKAEEEAIGMKRKSAAADNSGSGSCGEQTLNLEPETPNLEQNISTEY